MQKSSELQGHLNTYKGEQWHSCNIAMLKAKLVRSEYFVLDPVQQRRPRAPGTPGLERGSLSPSCSGEKLACAKWTRLVIGLCCEQKQLLIIQPGPSQRPTFLRLSNGFYSTHTLGETHRPCSCITVTMPLSNNPGCSCTPEPPHSLPPYLPHQVKTCQTLGAQHLAPMTILTMMPMPIALARTTVPSIAAHSS